MKKIISLFSFFLLITSNIVLADIEKGKQIFVELDKQATGFNDTKAELKMILLDPDGEKTIRNLKMKTLEVEGDGNKSLILFNSPKDIKGTGFLSFTHALEPDDQWLYLPALKRIKRISSTNKSGPFLGSEFAFEDLASFELEKFSYNYLHDGVINDIDCFVVELIPLYEHSGYSKQISWVDKTRYIILKTDYYDRKNELLKTLTLENYKQYLNQFWRAEKMIMVNHVSKRTTHLVWNSYHFDNGFSDRDFDTNMLKRSR